MTSVFLVLAVFLPKEYFLNFASLGKFWSSCVFVINITYTVEIYTTEIRGLGLGFCNLMGRFGGCIFPIVALGLLDLTG